MSDERIDLHSQTKPDENIDGVSSSFFLNNLASLPFFYFILRNKLFMIHLHENVKFVSALKTSHDIMNCHLKQFCN